METSQKKLSKHDWDVIVGLWETGDFTLSEISEKFAGVTVAALSQGLQRRGAVKGGKSAAAVQKAIQDKIRNEQAKIIEEIYDFRKKFIRYNSFIAEETVNLLNENKKTSTPYSGLRDDLEALNMASKNVNNTGNNIYKLYDLHKESKDQLEQESFNIGVYTDQEIASMAAEKKRVLEEMESNYSNDEDDSEDET